MNGIGPDKTKQKVLEKKYEGQVGSVARPGPSHVHKFRATCTCAHSPKPATIPGHHVVVDRGRGRAARSTRSVVVRRFIYDYLFSLLSPIFSHDF